MHSKESVDATISYSLGCGSALIGWVCQTTELWQAIALFLGVIVVAIRAIHDAVKLYRYIKKGVSKS